MSHNNLLNIEQKYNRIIVFFYGLMILVLPVSIALVEIMAVLVILTYLIKIVALNMERSRSGQRTNWTGLFIPDRSGGMDHFQKAVLIFMGCTLISVCLSRFPAASWIAFFGKLLEGYYLYLVFVDSVRTRVHFRNCLAFSVGAVFLMSIDGLFQFMTGSDFLRRLPLEGNRVSATLRHANDFGAYLIAYIPLIFGFLIIPVRKGVTFLDQWKKGDLSPDWSAKVFIAVVFLLMVACLGLTFSRGSWVGFWFSMLVFVILMRKFFIPALIVSIIFLAVFLPFLMKYRDVSFTTDSVGLVKEYGNIEPTSENLEQLSELERHRVMLAHRFSLGMGRFGFWEEATDLIKKYPIFGSGLNTYSKLTTGYAHNCYLQMAGETGLVGLMAFLVMIGVLFWQSLRSFMVIDGIYFRVLLAACLAGLAGFLLQSFFDTTLYSVQLGNLLWVVIGFIVAIPRVARSVE